MKLKTENPRRKVDQQTGNVIKAVVATPQSTGARQFKFVISTSDVDTANDVVNQDGWDLTHFKGNPVCLWNHDSTQLPIGRCIEIGVEDGRLKATVEFATAEANPFADQVYRLIQAGFLNATSVAFDPIEMSETDDPARGADTYDAGVDFQRQTLFEFSIVNLPCNPFCLIEPGQRPDDEHTELNKHHAEHRARKLDLHRHFSRGI